MDNKKKNFIIQALRRASYRWPSRWLAEKRSKVGRNQYCCENSDCGLILPKRETQMDHVIPCVDPIEGFTTFDSYADRMFPDKPEGFQRLCRDCHDKKTQEENSVRKDSKQKKKLDKDK